MTISLTIGCQDIIEEDIGDAEVVTNAPQKDSRYEEGLIQFWWDEVDDALDYRLEVVAGKFAQPSYLELDTTVTSKTFNHFLFAGTYEWRVTASNASSKTTSEAITFYIDSLENLSSQQLLQTFPASNACLNDNQLSFAWIALPFSNVSYEFEIRDASFSQGSTVMSELNATFSSYSANLQSLTDGQYSWGVRAKNDQSISPFSIRYFDIDRTAPTTPLLSTPVNGDSLETGDITLTWSSESGNTSGCPVNDSIYVFSDAQLTTEVVSGESTSESIVLQGLNTGSYYWYVISIDQAGNKGNLSAVFQFFIEE